MTPLGIVAVAVAAIAFVAYRWWGLSRTGDFDPRTEWPYWLFAVGAVLISVVVTAAGRLAMLVLTPIILIPAGAYLLYRSEELGKVIGLDVRNAGWLAIITGVLGGLAAAADIWFQP